MNPGNVIFRFAGFELDARAGELRRNGDVTRLQEKPLLALVTLLENQGSVVTREELRHRLWPGDVYVDYEQGLGNALLKLREALGDSARNPRFIETLPRRGYRFLAPVELIGGSPHPPATASQPAKPARTGLVFAASAVAVLAIMVTVLIALSIRPAPNGMPADSQAWEAYLRARHLANQKTPDGLQKSVGYYREALAREPRFAMAWAGLAESFHFLGALNVFSRDEAYRFTSDAAHRALAIDPSLAEAHAILAETSFRFGPDSAQAAPHFRRALQLAPHSGVIRQWHANYLAHLNRNSEALAEMQLAHRLDPVSLHINVDLAWMLYDTGHREEAMQHARRTLELDADYPKTHYLLGYIHRKEKRLGPAIAEFRRVVELAPDTPKFLEALAVTLADAGRRAEAESVLLKIKSLQSIRRVPPEMIRQLEERLQAARPSPALGGWFQATLHLNNNSNHSACGDG